MMLRAHRSWRSKEYRFGHGLVKGRWNLWLIRPCAIAALVATLLHCNVQPLWARRPDAAWSLEFGRYLANPTAGRRQLLRSVWINPDDAPTQVLLLAADAELHRGRHRAARVLLTIVSGRPLAEPFDVWTSLSLGWACVMAGRNEEARWHLRSAERSCHRAGRVAAVLSGLLDARDGDASAVARLSTTAQTAAGDRDLRDVARLATVYARLWTNQLASTEDWDDESEEQSPLADDVQFAAAWVRYRGGDVDRAVAAWTALADGTTSTSQPGAKLVLLDPEAVFASAMRRYRSDRDRVRAPGEGFARLWDLEASTLSAGALRMIAASSSPIADGGGASRTIEAARARAETARPITQRPTDRFDAQPEPSGWWVFVVLTIATGALIAGAAVCGRPSARERRSGINR